MSWITRPDGTRGHIQTEACRPYDVGLNHPVSIWDIIDRLDRGQLRDLVMGFSVHSPVAFERQLLELGRRDSQ